MHFVQLLTIASIALTASATRIINKSGSTAIISFNQNGVGPQQIVLAPGETSRGFSTKTIKVHLDACTGTNDIDFPIPRNSPYILTTYGLAEFPSKIRRSDGLTTILGGGFSGCPGEEGPVTIFG